MKDVIQKESEIKIKEKPEPKYQIDPETGRLPGVEAPIKESDLGTTDVITAYRARQRPVVFESGKIAKSRFMAEKTAQEQGLIGELTKDPNSEGWLVRPSREASKQYIKEMTAEWEKFLEEDMKASEKLDVAEDPSTWDTLKQILSSERGELKIESSDFKSIQDFIKRHKISPRDAMEMLSNQGISDKQIGKILSIPSIQKSNIGEPDKDSKWLKPGQKGSEMLPARKLAKGKEAPQVSRKDARTIEQAPNINAPMFGEKLRWKTSEGLLTSLGDPVREIFFRHAIKGERQASDITVKLIKESNQLKKSLPIKSRWKSSERIDNYAMSRQKNGKARLEAMGVKIIERLNPKEQKVYDKLQEIYKDLYNQINTQRRAIGQNEFPAVKNYSTWIHDLAKLDSVEKISMLSKMATIQKGLDRMGKFPSKIDKMGRVPGMKGHEKFRGGPDTPGALKLDAFDNFNRYAVMAGDVIGKSKDLAYLHELLHPQFELYKNAPNTYNFLSEWLDYQKGREHHLFITNPKTRRILGRLQGNIAVSYLTYAPKSVFVQLSSINNSIAEIGATRLGQGFSRSLNPASVKRALKESNILSTRTPEFIIMDAMSQIPTLPGKVGKVLHKTGKRAKQIGMKPLSIADNIVAIATWLGAEVQAKGRYKKAKTDKDIQTFARDFADDVVVRAQGSAARSARSPIQRSAEGKFVTTLQTFTIANWDYITRHLMGIKNPDITKPQQLAKAMKWIATSTIISQGFEELEWRSPIPQPVRAFQESLEQTSDKVKAIIAAGKELLEFIPIYGGKYKFGSEITGAVMEQLVRLGGGDITALPRLMGMPGYSTLLKGYRAEKREGTAVDILMGRYVKKLRKRLSKMGMGGL